MKVQYIIGMIVSFFCVTFACGATYIDTSGLPDAQILSYLQVTRGLQVFPEKRLYPQREITYNELAKLLTDVDGNIPGVTDSGSNSREILQKNGIFPLKIAGNAVVTRQNLQIILQRWQQFNGRVGGKKMPALNGKSVPVTRYEAIRSVYYALYGTTMPSPSGWQDEERVWQKLLGYYGSPANFFANGIIYREQNAVVIGVYPEKREHLEAIIPAAWVRSGNVRIRSVVYSQQEYLTQMKKVKYILKQCGDGEKYRALVPNYERQQLILTVSQPLRVETRKVLQKNILPHMLYVVAAGQGNNPQYKENLRREKNRLRFVPYVPGLSPEMEQAIDDFQYEVMR